MVEEDGVLVGVSVVEPGVFAGERALVDEELDMVERGSTKDKFRALGGRSYNG